MHESAEGVFYKLPTRLGRELVRHSFLSRPMRNSFIVKQRVDASVFSLRLARSSPRQSGSSYIQIYSLQRIQAKEQAGPEGLIRTRSPTLEISVSFQRHAASSDNLHWSYLGTCQLDAAVDESAASWNQPKERTPPCTSCSLRRSLDLDPRIRYTGRGFYGCLEHTFRALPELQGFGH